MDVAMTTFRVTKIVCLWYRGVRISDLCRGLRKMQLFNAVQSAPLCFPWTAAMPGYGHIAASTLKIENARAGSDHAIDVRRA